MHAPEDGPREGGKSSRRPSGASSSAPPALGVCRWCEGHRGVDIDATAPHASGVCWCCEGHRGVDIDATKALILIWVDEFRTLTGRALKCTFLGRCVRRRKLS